MVEPVGWRDGYYCFSSILVQIWNQQAVFFCSSQSEVQSLLVAKNVEYVDGVVVVVVVAVVAFDAVVVVVVVGVAAASPSLCF